MQPDSKVDGLFSLAQKLAHETPAFFETKGPGKGDRAANKFMNDLQKLAFDTFGQDCSQKKVMPTTNFTLDFYFPDERVAVEIALGLDKPLTEYERDIFKCLLARESGYKVDRLIFFTKPGGVARQSAPGPKAIADYARRHFALDIEIIEFKPNPTR